MFVSNFPQFIIVHPSFSNHFASNFALGTLYPCLPGRLSGGVHEGDGSAGQGGHAM